MQKTTFRLKADRLIFCVISNDRLIETKNVRRRKFHGTSQDFDFPRDSSSNRDNVNIPI